MRCTLFLSVLILLACGETTEETRFISLPTGRTGVDFRNTITEDSVDNILNFTNLYTGSGVGIGDFNNDGLEDIFFGGNQVSSELYLNRGQLRFEKIGHPAGIETDRWVTGVSVVDIDQDGLLDVYLSVSGFASPEQRKNLLFRNMGGERPRFEEVAEDFGLADTSQVTHTAFFDYDKDGDLDAYMIVNPTDYQLNSVNTIRRKKTAGEAPSTDRLYRNNGDGSFSDVSREAGILIEGYSLGVSVCDLNADGWPDVYVTNDFLPNDLLYINNQDGSFSNRAPELLRHTSFAAMGVDVADLTNDGLSEIYVADMHPRDHFRQKMILSAGSYDRFAHMIRSGYEPQYSRNTLQLNQGRAGFSEIGQMAGLHQTDWSWAVLLADYDNDGWKDIFVTNGFRRDLGSLDYINYGRNNPFGSPEAVRARMLENIRQQPGAQLPNYAFRNIGEGLQFEDVSEAWGLGTPSFAHGAAYADLDLDGDLDLVVNNVQQVASIYENRTIQQDPTRFLSVELRGTAPNRNALGARVELTTDAGTQMVEHTAYRGYQSSMGQRLHFGLADGDSLRQLTIHWPDGRTRVLPNPPVNSFLVAGPQNGIPLPGTIDNAQTTIPTWFRPMDTLYAPDLPAGPIDFKIQSLLPYQLSLTAPAFAQTDVDGDGQPDVFFGDRFAKNRFSVSFERPPTQVLFLDVDGDGDEDLYAVYGGMSFRNLPRDYQDRLYLNDGQGNFSPTDNALPDMATSTYTIVPHDFDSDGDPDLFVGGRMVPGSYPETPRSYLLQNEDGRFRDVTEQLAPELARSGMIRDAIWTDHDGDGDRDLLLAAEWQALVVYSYEDGRFAPPRSLPTGTGWWNCVRAGDFDADGDEDYLLGNLGWNTNYRASRDRPFRLYAADFDQNGSIDPILTHYVDDVEVPVATRDQLIAQIPPIKSAFTDYRSYASSDFSDLRIALESLRGVACPEPLSISEFGSGFLKNMGGGKFEWQVFPVPLQIAPIRDFLVHDWNKDGFSDAAVVGNDHSTEVNLGRYDAFNGMILLGNETGSLETLESKLSGFFAPDAVERIVWADETHRSFWIVTTGGMAIKFESLVSEK